MVRAFPSVTIRGIPLSGLMSFWSTGAMVLQPAKAFEGWQQTAVAAPFILRVETSCPIHEELFATLHYFSEVRDTGLPGLKARTGLPASQVSRVLEYFQWVIRQAKDYFNAALHLPYNTAPLLYYYAFLNLAKARLCITAPQFILHAKRI